MEEEVHALDEPQEVPRHGFLQTHRQRPGWKDHTAGVHRRHLGLEYEAAVVLFCVYIVVLFYISKTVNIISNILRISNQ